MVVNKGVFTYSYSVPGTYRVVCVASTYLDLGKDMRVDTASVIVNVVDNVTDIDKLSSKIYYDEIYAEEKENDEWLLMLPYKMRYNNKDLSISMSQKLNFSIASDSTKVFINIPQIPSTIYPLRWISWWRLIQGRNVIINCILAIIPNLNLSG